MSAPPPTVNVTICACEEDHVAAITTIYAHHVLHRLASVLRLLAVASQAQHRCPLAGAKVGREVAE